MPSLKLSNLIRRRPGAPSLKDRAAALKASAARVMRRRAPVAAPVLLSAPLTGADPRLVAMVKQCQDARRVLNDPAIPDGPEADALGETETRLLLEILRFPSQSAHDLAAKLPFLREEAEDAGRGWDTRRGVPFEASVPGAAWAGLLRDIEHLAGAAPSQSEHTAPAGGLSACSIRQLTRLYETLSARWHMASVSMGAPFVWDGDNYSAAGRILDNECERLAEMMEDIAREMKGREASDEEVDDRLAVLVRQDIEGSGCVTNRVLLDEINAAWGA